MMANRSSGNPQKSKHSRNARTSPQNPKQHVKRFKKLGASYPKRRMPSNPRNQKRQEEQRTTYCIVAYAFSLLTASILWWLQVPNQVVYALLIVSILIVLLCLIPLKSRYREFVNRCLLLIIVTFFISVLGLTWGEFIQMLAHFLPITSK